jgi:hypothetical protein
MSKARLVITTVTVDKRPVFGCGLRYRLVPTRGNGLMVIALTGHYVSVITRFDNSNLARFGLPRTLDA